MPSKTAGSEKRWTHRDWAPAQVCTRLSCKNWQKWTHASIPSPEATPGWQPLANENLVFSQAVSLGKQTPLRGRLRARHRCRQATNSTASLEVPCPCQIYFYFCFMYIHFPSLFTLQVLCIYMMAPSLGFSWDSWVCDSWPLHLYLFHVPALGLQSIGFWLMLLLCLHLVLSDLCSSLPILTCSPFPPAWLLELKMLIPWDGSFQFSPTPT